MSARLKPGLWVGAQLRRCDRLGLPFAVLRHGDDHGGAIILKLVRGDGAVELLTQATADDGSLAWRRPLGPGGLSEADADGYIAREAKFDPDVWALEIIDRAGVFEPEGAILDEG